VFGRKTHIVQSGIGIADCRRDTTNTAQGSRTDKWQTRREAGAQSCGSDN